jgi:hypothetical protein
MTVIIFAINDDCHLFRAAAPAAWARTMLPAIRVRRDKATVFVLFTLGRCPTTPRPARINVYCSHLGRHARPRKYCYVFRFLQPISETLDTSHLLFLCRMSEDLCLHRKFNLLGKRYVVRSVIASALAFGAQLRDAGRVCAGLEKEKALAHLAGPGAE